MSNPKKYCQDQCEGAYPLFFSRSFMSYVQVFNPFFSCFLYLSRCGYYWGLEMWLVWLKNWILSSFNLHLNLNHPMWLVAILLGSTDTVHQMRYIITHFQPFKLINVCSFFLGHPLLVYSSNTFPLYYFLRDVFWDSQDQFECPYYTIPFDSVTIIALVGANIYWGS